MNQAYETLHRHGLETRDELRWRATAISTMLQQFLITTTDKTSTLFCDVACGVGRLVLDVCDALSATFHGLGMDVNPSFLDWARECARQRKLDSRCDFLIRDAIDVDLDRVSAVLLCLSPAGVDFMMRRVLPRSGLKIGTMILSVGLPLSTDRREAQLISSYGACGQERCVYCYKYIGDGICKPRCLRNSHDNRVSMHVNTGTQRPKQKKAPCRSNSTADLPDLEKPRRGSQSNLGAFQARTLERLERYKKQSAIDAARQLHVVSLPKRGSHVDIEAFQAETAARATEQAAFLEEEKTNEVRNLREESRRRWEELAALQPYSVATALATATAAHMRCLEPLPCTSIGVQPSMSMAELDSTLTAAGVSVLALGDCHASRTVCLVSSFHSSHFFGGSIYSWIAGKRELPPLRSLYALDPLGGGDLVLVISYGAIDCRCHSSKWFGNPESLSEPYIAKVCDYIAEFNEKAPRVRVVPIILAVPPTMEQDSTPLAPCRDALDVRVKATASLNTSLESVCVKLKVAHTGADTWDFAKDIKGALRSDLSDSHGHVLSKHCEPVRIRLHKLIHGAIGV